MPIYEYRCRSCGHEFEVIQKVGARALRKCEECSGRIEKLISRTSFQLKGGGWFASDYGKGGGGKSAPSSGPSSSSDSSSSAKTDSTKNSDK